MKYYGVQLDELSLIDEVDLQGNRPRREMTALRFFYDNGCLLDQYPCTAVSKNLHSINNDGRFTAVFAACSDKPPTDTDGKIHDVLRALRCIAESDNTPGHINIDPLAITMSTGDGRTNTPGFDCPTLYGKGRVREGGKHRTAYQRVHKRRGRHPPGRRVL